MTDFNHRLNDLAHRKGPCPAESVGLEPDDRIVARPHKSTCECGGSGELFLLGDAVRKRCRNPRCKKGQIQSTMTPNIYAHKTCKGHGTVASDRMEDWADEATRKWTVTFLGMGEYIRCHLDSEVFGDFFGDGANTLVALIGAIEKAVGNGTLGNN